MLNTKPSSSWALAGLSLCMLLSSLGTSIANVALPTFAQAFGATFQQVQWVVLAYLLAVTTLIVTVGRLGDIAGRRRLLLWGVAVFLAGAVSCGAAPTLDLLVGARAIQGLGAAVMMALSLAIVSETVPKARIGRAMGLLGTTSAIGTAIGPSVGGLLIDSLSWRAVFLVKVPLGLVAWFLVKRHLPVDRPMPAAKRVQFDHIGTLLLGITLGTYALAMTLGRGTFGSLNATLLVVAGVGICAFLFAESRVRSPLVHLSMFRDGGLSAGLAMSLLVSTVLMASLVVGPFYLTGALGLEPALIGMVMSIGPVVAAVMGVPSGRAVDRFGPERATLAGLGGMVLGCLLLATVPTRWGVIGYLLPMVVVTANYALFQAANNTGVMRGVEPGQRGVVSGMLNLSRNLGLITGTSAMGAVFALAVGGNEIRSAPATAVAAGLRTTFATGSILLLVAIAAAVVGQRLAARQVEG